jgi:hypothetical protein
MDLPPKFKTPIGELGRLASSRASFLWDSCGQILKDTLAIEFLTSLYHATEVKIRIEQEQEGAGTTFRFSREDVLVLRKMTTDVNPLQAFSTKRDQINNWLLESLRYSDKLVELHRSFLPEGSMDEKEWARQVLKYWSLDDAATGADLGATISEGAVDSRNSGANSFLLGKHTMEWEQTNIQQ